MRAVRVVVLSWLVIAVVSMRAYADPSPSAAASPAAAQMQPQKLPPVVVTATRIEQPLSDIGTTVSVVDRSQMQSQQLQQMTDVLREVPGVSVMQGGSPGTQADVMIRGATPSQTLILLDGVEVNTGASGSFDISNLTTDNLDRTEVVRGAGGSLYGSQAIGGVVNLLSQEGEGPAKASILSEGGNRASERQLLAVNGADGSLGYSGALSYFSTEGFQRINDSSDNLSGQFRLDWHVDEKTTIRGFARYYRSNVSLPDFTIFSGQLNPTAHQRGEFMLFKAEVEREIIAHLIARISASFVRNEIRVSFPPYPGNTGLETSERDRIPEETRGALAEAVYTWPADLLRIPHLDFDGWRTLAGFDFKDRWLRTSDFSTFTTPPPSISFFTARRQEYAGYLEQEAGAFDGHLLGTGGFRVDDNSQFGKEVSSSWSVAAPIKEIGLTIRGSYSEGFRAPAFDELFFPFFGNRKLSPEISSEYDGGFTQTFGDLFSFTGTYFSRRVHSLIVTVPVPVSKANPFGSMAGNAGRVDVQGLELAPSFGPYYGFSLNGGFTVLDETHIGVNEPLRVPKRSAYAVAQYEHRELLLPRDKMTLSLAYTFVGDRDDITPIGTIRNHVGYHRLDATASYDAQAAWNFISNEELFGRVSNLFDRHYAEEFGFPSPPVNFLAGIKLEFE
ncbi:MAG TPA: TonB-dependent receptor [Candidatus Binataceae bacterium]|nr:TonB-dependent receptor [Candidatus Binataceae bacterium]